MRLIRLLKRDIAREAAEWVDEGIISEPQAEQVCQRYGVDFHDIKNHSLAYSMLLGLGYLFIGLSLITLIGANWETIPREVRMGGLLLLTAMTQGLGIYRYSRGDRRAAGRLFFLGNLFYGASIILIAQIYHLGEHMPDGVFWWALGWLPMAVLTRQPLLTIPMLALALLWFFMEAHMGFYPALMPLFLVAGFWVLCRSDSSLTLLLLVISGILFWLEYSLGFWWNDFYRLELFPEHLPLSGALLLLLYTVGATLAARSDPVSRDYGVTLDLWVVRGTVLCLLVMSYREPWKALLDGPWSHLPSLLVLMLSVLVTALYLGWRMGLAKIVAALGSGLLLLLGAVLVSGSGEHSLYFQVLANLLLVGFSAGLIVQGIRNGLSHYFFLGVATVLFTAFVRYLDLIGDYVGGAALFLVFAMLLLGAARYWKYRQRQGEGEA